MTEFSEKIKTFTIDYNNPTALKRFISQLQKRRKDILRSVGADLIQFNGSTYNMKKIVSVFESILETDIASLQQIDNEDKQYYVYVHCDPSKILNIRADIKHYILATKFGLKNEPFYVGKGKGNRCYELERNDSHRKIRSIIKRQNKEIIVEKISTNLNEIDALSLEAKIIDILGLRSLSKVGLLVNLDEGIEPTKRRTLYPSHDGRTIKVLRRNGFVL